MGNGAFMQIEFHRGDLPSDIDFGDSVAVDTETLGLNPLRDRLCLVQLSAGDDSAHVVQLGAGASRALLMRRYVMRGTLLPFFLGAVLGAAAGAQIFITLPTAALQGIIGGSILLLIWMPKIARIGAERRRFAAVGFAASFLGMFVSASGAMIAPFVASASPPAVPVAVPINEVQNGARTRP